MEKFSLTDIKKMNYSDVYHFIYEYPQSAKQAIANTLQMSLPTVSQHLMTLTLEGLIAKCGQLESQIGRKAAAYAVVPQAKVSVGVEILQDRTLIVVLDLYGEQIDRLNLQIIFEDKNDYFKKISHSILEFMRSLSLEETQVLGVGFGLQGLVSQDGTKIIYGKILNCTGLSIQAFQQYLPFPCRFMHDSECAALSDLWHNTAITDAIYLSIGHHLGGALIIDGNVSSGRTGRSGTFEHMTLVPDGQPCYCGQKGCMECYCSAQALLKDEESLSSYFEAKEKGDTDAVTRWDTFLKYLAMAANNLHMVIDCNIVIGGHIAPYLTESDLTRLHQLVQENTAFPEKEPFIYQGQRRKHAVAVGAALPFINSFLTEI